MPLWYHVWVTIQEALTGFFSGVVIGLVAGVALGRNRMAADVLSIYIKVFNSVPRVVLAPIFIMLFGLGLTSKVALSHRDDLVNAAVRLFLPLLVAAGLAGCAVWPRSIEISEAQLQQQLDRQFPVSRQVLRIFDVTLGQPQLTLLPASNRIATAFDVSIGERWLREPYRGSFALSYGLRYEPRDATIRLADVHVEQLRLEGAPAALQRELDRFGVLLAEQLLDGEVIHTFSATDVAAAQRQGLEPGAIHVGRHAISIGLQRVVPR